MIPSTGQMLDLSLAYYWRGHETSMTRNSQSINLLELVVSPFKMIASHICEKCSLIIYILNDKYICKLTLIEYK